MGICRGYPLIFWRLFNLLYALKCYKPLKMWLKYQISDLAKFMLKNRQNKKLSIRTKKGSDRNDTFPLCSRNKALTLFYQKISSNLESLIWTNLDLTGKCNYFQPSIVRLVCHCSVFETLLSCILDYWLTYYLRTVQRVFVYLQKLAQDLMVENKLQPKDRALTATQLTKQPINVKTHHRHLWCKIHERPLFGESLIETVQARSIHDKIIFRAACSVPTHTHTSEVY